ncbi:TRAP transporter small permease [Shimia thalassica]|uniref:TRAP transporter small permease n=1 Tax=Shimia thalassica TaxID=1715693 RepID=UPI0026E3DD74|nr:TRAP transporter small permease [Shimia thalassica]MDO6523768.1 TRAP transporter small permease [Shimia thalassica]
MEDAPRWMKQTERVLDGLSFLCMLIASIALVVLIVTFGWLVFGRYVLNSTPTWVEQLALLLICYITYLGAAVGIHDNTHLGVTIFRDMMPSKINSFLRLLIDIILAAFGLIMMIASIDLVVFGWSTLLPMLSIPEGVRSLSAALCGGLVFIFAGTRVAFRIACHVHGKTYVERGLI